MNSIRLFVCTLMLTASTVSAADPEVIKTRYLRLLEKYSTMLNTAIHRTQGSMLAKQTKTKVDTAMVTHIDVSIWDTIANIWKNDGYIDLVYDGQGRTVELKGFALADSVTFTFKQDFDQNGIRVRQEITLTEVVLSTPTTVTMVELIDYYPGYGSFITPGILDLERFTFFPLSSTITPPVVMTRDLDSIIQTTLMYFSAGAPPDTTTRLKTRFFHSNDTSIQTRKESFNTFSSLEPEISEGEITIKGLNGRIDSVRVSERGLTSSGTYRIIYTYDQMGRMTGQAEATQAAAPNSWTNDFNTVISYTGEGRIAVQINQNWNDEQDIWENSEKFIPTYTIIGRSLVRTAPLPVAGDFFRIVARIEAVCIQAPAGCHILSVHGFDLRGRLTDVNAALLPGPVETATIRRHSGCRSMQLFRVRTDRGDVLLKVNGGEPVQAGR